MPKHWVVTITNQAYLDLIRTLQRIYPTPQINPTPDEVILGLNTLIHQVAIAAMNLPMTALKLNHNAKDAPKQLHGVTLVQNMWPPAFTMRRETEDEAEARVALAEIASEGFFERA